MSRSSVDISRRGFILTGAGSTLLLASTGPAQSLEPDLDALMVTLEKLADELPFTTRDQQDAYILKVAAQAILVQQWPIPKMGTMGRTGVEIGPLRRTEPPTDMVHGIALVHYRLAPNAVMQAHNHPNYSVATVGIEGEALVTHYESDPSAPPFASTDPFTIRRTAERLLRPQEATTLSPSRDNIHTFRAGPKGARFVDLFSIHGNDVGFSYLDVEQQPTAAGGDSFRARWIGKRPSNA